MKYTIRIQLVSFLFVLFAAGVFGASSPAESAKVVFFALLQVVAGLGLTYFRDQRTKEVEATVAHLKGE